MELLIRFSSIRRKSSSFATVVSIRKKIVEHKKLEKWEKQFKRDNPQYFEWNYKTAERMEKDKEIKEILEMWNST